MESYSMAGGDGLDSYSKNSSLQRTAVDGVKHKVEVAIKNELTIHGTTSLWSNPNLICIADIGCSVGPNTFLAMQTILDALEKAYKSEECEPEFMVLFNDHACNDFNTLFTTLPSHRRYLAAGVPGSFHGRLFPHATIHCMHSSYALHWLSKVPEEVVDGNSPAWNKGRISYTSAPREVVEAYSKQFSKDMELFFRARAQELVAGGLMLLVLPSRKDGSPTSESPFGLTFYIMGEVLKEMAAEGMVDMAKLDHFNIPMYTPSSDEFRKLIESNDSYIIETIQTLFVDSLNSSTDSTNASKAKLAVNLARAAFANILSKQFGAEIIPELFRRCEKKAEKNLHEVLTRAASMPYMFVVLKRKE